MSKEHLTDLIEPSILPLTSRHYHNYFTAKLCCIICNTPLDIYTKDHTCILREKHTDIVIHNKNIQHL